MKEKLESKYTHMDYRKAKVVHLIDALQEEKFMYKGKPISKADADNLVKEYLNRKKQKI